MPKASTPKAKQTLTPKNPSKADRVKRYTADISNELCTLRSAVGYPATEPSCDKPALQPGEEIVKRLLYHGVSHHVDGPSHSKFGSLGRFMWVIKKPGQKHRFVVEPNTIPYQNLVANENLLSLLMLRSELTFPRSSPSRTKAPISTPSKAPTPFPLATTHDETNEEEEDAIEVSNGTYTLIGSEPISDDEIEIIDHPEERLPSVSSKVTTAISSSIASEGGSDEIDQLDSEEYFMTSTPSKPPTHDRPSLSSPAITVLAWTKNSELPRSMSVEVRRGAGSYISLSMFTHELQVFGLQAELELDRFVRGKGWRRITWNTVFPIGETRLIVLKLASVKEIKDWDIQIEHLYY